MRYFKIAIRFLLRQKRNSIISILGISLATLLLITTCNMVYSNELKRLSEVANNMGRYQYRFSNITKEKANILKKHAKVRACNFVKNLGYVEYNYRIIKVDDIEENALREVFSFDVLKGRYPLNSDEIAISSRLLENLMKNNDIGDKVSLKINNGNSEFEKEFTIVGIIDEKAYRKEEGDVYGSILTKAYEEKSTYDCYIDVFDSQDLASICTNIDIKYSKENILTRPYYDGAKMLFNNADNGGVVIILIILISYMFIANSFKITIKERTEIIVLARTVGTAPNQVWVILFIEVLITSLFGVGLGVSISYIVSGLVLYNEVLIGCIPILIISILYSTIFFFIYIAYSKPEKLLLERYVWDDDCLKSSLNRRNIERSLAIRNIKLQGKNVTRTIMPLTLSMMLFILLYCNYAMKIEEYNEKVNSLWDIQYQVGDEGIKEEEIECIKNIEGVEEIYRNQYSVGYIFMRNMYYDDTSVNGRNTSTIFKYKDFRALKAKIIDGNKDILNIGNNPLFLTYKEVSNIKEGEVAIIKTKNLEKFYTFERLSDKAVLILNEKKLVNYNGNEISKNICNALDENNFTPLKTKLLIPKDVLLNNFIENEYDITIILNHNDYSNLIGSKLYDSAYIKVQYDKVDKVIERISYMKKGASNNIYNMKSKREELMRNLKLEITYQYGAGIIVAIISLLNIMNWAMTSVISRKKELLLYKAIGMSNMQIAKMILWEATIIAMISCCAGAAIGGGFTITYPIRMLFQGKFYIVGWLLTLVGFAVIIILLTIIGTVISLKRVEKKIGL